MSILAGVKTADAADLGIERPRVANVPLQRFRTEFWMNRVVLEPMHVDDVFCEVQIRFLVALIEDHEE